MLYLFDEDGNMFETEGGTNRYVKVAEPDTAMVWVCPTSGDFDAEQVTCTGEPENGECAPADEVSVPISAPEVDGPMGTVEGFHVVVEDRWTVDPVHPSESQEALLLQMCASACRQFFAGRPGVTANCDAADAFDPPEALALGGHRALDFVATDRQHAEGVFPGQVLPCAVGADCHEHFDEALAAAVPRRSTPAQGTGQGEEWRVALGSGSQIAVITDQGPYVSPLSGTVGYSECEGGNATAPCPFFLGSLEAEATSTLNVSMTCLDQSTAQVSVSDLSMALGQPAFGIAKQGSAEKGFAPGALMMETSLVADATPVSTRMTNRVRVIGLEVDRGELWGQFAVGVALPCNESVGVVAVQVTLAGGTLLGSPPDIVIETPSTVSCGVPVELEANAGDPDDDLASVFPVRSDFGELNCPSTCREDGTCSVVTAVPRTLDAHCPSTST